MYLVALYQKQSQVKSSQTRTQLIIVTDNCSNCLTKCHFLASTGTDFWAGATDNFAEGSWLWPNSNTPINCDGDFCDWRDGEPNGGKNENCLEVTNFGNAGHWNDANCNDWLFHYICEKPIAKDVKKTAWIGLNDIDSTQTVVWTDNTPVSFTKW